MKRFKKLKKDMRKYYEDEKGECNMFLFIWNEDINCSKMYCVRGRSRKNNIFDKFFTVLRNNGFNIM